MPPLQVFQDKANPQSGGLQQRRGRRRRVLGGHRAEERAREYAEWLSGRRRETILIEPVSV